MLSRRPLIAGLVAGLAVVGMAAVWAGPEPVPAIAAELRAAVRDPSNHAPYADLLRAELAAAGRLETMTVTLPCFWAGESHFGGQRGVYRTTPGTQAGHEAVRVAFDPTLTSRDRLMTAPESTKAVGRGCRFDPATAAAAKHDPAFRPDTDAKWSLRQADGLKYVPMTPAQATRINALVHLGEPVDAYLCPAQRTLLGRVRANPDGNWTDHIDDERLWTAVRTGTTAK